MYILLIEDDKYLAWSVKANLEKNGYTVDWETEGLTGQECAGAFSYDLIILDIMLPDTDGFSVCEYIRRKKISTPILMLTARYEESDKVRGLDSGADDYLAKPFSYPELFARVRALIRRSYGHSNTEIIVGELSMNTSRKTVFYRTREVSLTSKEYAILEYLTVNRNGIVTREMIEEHTWGSQDTTFSNVVEVLVSRLRKKLDTEDREAVIQTVKGLGYTIRDEKP